MNEILLIRHGITPGNKLGRYIGGRTDESLSEEGIEFLKSSRSLFPTVQNVYTSPMKRCLETAGILFPECEPVCVEEFRECDFGEFENKNYHELSGNPDYQAWIDSGGTLPFPGGESVENFKKRCTEAFDKIVTISKGQRGRTALVVHGGTIMSIMEKYGFPCKKYYDYQVENGHGYLLLPLEGKDLWNYQYLP